MNLQPITDSYWIAAQIQPSDVEELSALGFTTVICNRPDAEDAGQPSAAEIAAACAAANLEFHHIPVTSMPIATSDIELQHSIVASSQGKVLAYCRSGHRSTVIFAASA